MRAVRRTSKREGLRSRLAGVCALFWAMGALGCASDGAVSLARCIDRGAALLERSGDQRLRRPCDLAGRGASTVVVLPEGPLPERELRERGLSDSDLSRLNALELGGVLGERIRVLPAGERPRPSRTTAQRRSVSIPEPLVCRIEQPRIEIELVRSGGQVLLVGLD